jgi:hypothetical protein
MPEGIIYFLRFRGSKIGRRNIYGYDLLPFPEAALGLITGPEKYDVGEAIAQ